MNALDYKSRKAELSATEFMTAKEKIAVVRDWLKFLAGGLDRKCFTPRLYQHLIMHCGFIAHYDLGGFYGAYFIDVMATRRFLNQFDRMHGCCSAEGGSRWWCIGGNSTCAANYDINNLMVDIAEEHLPQLRKQLEEQDPVRILAGDLLAIVQDNTGLTPDYEKSCKCLDLMIARLHREKVTEGN